MAESAQRTTEAESECHWKCSKGWCEHHPEAAYYVSNYLLEQRKKVIILHTNYFEKMLATKFWSFLFIIKLKYKNSSIIIVFAFSIFQLERMVSWSSRAILLYLAAGYDLAHCLQLCDHHFEVQAIWYLYSKIMWQFIETDSVFLGHVSLQLHWVTCLCG